MDRRGAGSTRPADVQALTRGESIFISPVTLAELRFGAKITTDAGTRQRRLAALRRLERKPLLPIDGGTGSIFGSLAAQIKAAGRQHRCGNPRVFTQTLRAHHVGTLRRSHFPRRALKPKSFWMRSYQASSSRAPQLTHSSSLMDLRQPRNPSASGPTG